MKPGTRSGICVGDVVAAAFEEAALIGVDRREADGLATAVVMDLLRSARRVEPRARRRRPMRRPADANA